MGTRRDRGRSAPRRSAALRARILLIRRVDRRLEGQITAYAVDTADGWLGRAELGTIHDALDLDPRHRDRFAHEAGPLAAVCTHGRRDPCCAERGRPLAAALAAAYPEATWESTHVGGDRFAGNLVVFPHGLYFGRVEPAEAPAIVEAYRSGRIALERFRGRASVPMWIQAAEIHLRRELVLDGLDDVRVQTIDRPPGGRRNVRFATPTGPRTVAVTPEPGTPMALTCHSDAPEIPIVWRATLVD